MGYAFKHYKRVLDRKYIIGKLTVNATEAVNNTNMYCVFEEAGNNDVTNRSLPATLLVVASK